MLCNTIIVIEKAKLKIKGAFFMIYTEMTVKAMQCAASAHSGQIDKGGAPYIFHPFYVAEQMHDELSTAVALLHDVVEDTPITIEYLSSLGFPLEVTDAVNVLTHPKGLPYKEYIERIKTNPIAVKVKMADLKHNMDLTRIIGRELTDKDRARVKKYADALKYLRGF